jgi:hypothetical protein
LSQHLSLLPRLLRLLLLPVLLMPPALFGVWPKEASQDKKIAWKPAVTQVSKC